MAAPSAANLRDFIEPSLVVSDPVRTAPPCRGVPAHRDPLDERDREVERDAEDAGDEDRRPGRLEVEERGRALDLDPERGERAAEVLADDRADHREHARHLQRGEEVRERGRDAHTSEDLTVARCVRVHQLDRRRPHRGEALEHVHEHREEAEHGGDRDLRALVDPEPGDRDRREGDDRHGVRGDEVRHQRRAERPEARQEERGDDRGRAAGDESPRTPPGT